jgi:Carboxypeptidase regulatory-like domain
MSARTLALVLWLGSAVVVVAQQAPARDTPARPSVGTASISGTVVADEPGGRPLRRVVVTLTPAGTGMTISRSTTTDDEGRFAFVRLPAGNYSALRAAKAGYVQMAYGQKRVGGMGVPIALAEGQRMTVEMKILKGGVITGTATDPQGRPAQSVGVGATAIRVVNGERLPGGNTFGSSATTDDRGIYRIYGLAPGDYLVVATARMPNSEDIHELTAEELRWAQQQLQGAGAGAPGAPTASAPSAPAASPRPGPAVTFAPEYFPGTTDPASATLVTVGPAQERSGIDLPVQFVRTARLQGSVVDPDGQPAQTVQLNVIPKVGAIGLNPSMMFESVLGTRPQVVAGKFTVPALRPGDYTISARAVPSGGASGTPTGPGRAGGAGAAPSLWATTEISVNGDDLSDVVLRLEQGMTISGRVTFEGTVLQPPSDLSTVSLRMTSAPNVGGMTISINPATAQVGADGSFTFNGITPGRYLLNASAPSGAPAPGLSWQAKSAIVNGVDGVDTPFEIKPGQNAANITLTFTDNMAEVSGTLSDATGKPTSEFSVILFSADKSKWGPRSRRLKQPIRTGADGKFKFTGLPAGEYYIAALTDFEPADVTNPVFLDQVAASAIKIAVAEGEKKTQDLKLAGQ